jgi:maleate cis-trans isomerase
MSGWKARIGYLSPSVFETPSEWDLILPKGFTLVASGLNVKAHTSRAVVSSTAACLWWVLKQLGMKIPIEGYGQILR